MRAVARSAFPLFVGILLVGCASKDPCHSVCEQANACSVSERSTDVDCDAFCSDVEAFNSRAASASCDAQFDAHVSCWEQNSAQLCSKEFAGCKESGSAWTTCMNAYCATTTSDPNCVGKPGARKSALLPF